MFLLCDSVGADCAKILESSLGNQMQLLDYRIIKIQCLKNAIIFANAIIILYIIKLCIYLMQIDMIH
jgi:hypothetical protein